MTCSVWRNAISCCTLVLKTATQLSAVPTMRLYKYCHPDRLDVLRDGLIRFSSPMVLNDPFESKPHIPDSVTRTYLEANFEELFLKTVADEYFKLPEVARRTFSLDEAVAKCQIQKPAAFSKISEFSTNFSTKFQSVFAKAMEEKIGVLCLTESSENLLMWAHYADSHQGFVIEFDTDHSFFDQRVGRDDEFRHLRRVGYCDKRPALAFGETDDFLPLITKSTDWRYEMEWRMMLPLSNATVIKGEGPTAIHLFEYPRETIKSVTFGCRMAIEKREEILKVIADVIQLRNVECRQTEIDARNYRLNFLPISV